MLALEERSKAEVEIGVFTNMKGISLVVILMSLFESTLSTCREGRDSRHWIYDCSRSEYTSIPWKEIGYISSEAKLFLNENNISKLERADLVKAKKVNVLHLHGNPIKILKSNVFYDLKKLFELTVSADEIQDGAFNGLDYLGHLSIMGSKSLSSLHRSILRSLPNLRKLVINGTSITTIQSRFLAGFNWLTYADLSHNKIQTIESNVMEKSLLIEQVQLSRNQLTKIPKDFSKKIWKLDLSRNYFTRIAEDQFSTYTELKHLDLSFNDLQEELPLNIFRNNIFLQSLKLQGTNISTLPGMNLLLKNVTDPSPFEYLKRLKYLDLSFNPFGGEFIVTKDQYFSYNIPFLKVLKLKNLGLRNFSFGGYQSFDEIDISGNCFVKGGLSMRLPSWHGIRILNASYSCLNQTFGPKYQHSNWILDLRGNNFRSAKINLAGVQDPGSLILSHNNIEKLVLHGNTEGLTLLDLSYNALSNTENITLLGEFSIHKLVLKGNPIETFNTRNMENVKFAALDLSDNHITEFPTNDILDSSGLIRHLNLANNRISKIPAALNMLEKLIELNLRNNSLVGLPYAIFSDASTLKKFDLSSNDLKCSCNLTITLNLMQNKDSVVGSCVDEKNLEQRNLTDFTNRIVEISEDSKCNLCPIEPCNLRGECQASNETGYHCNCDDGYTGRVCEINKANCFLTHTCGLCNDTICGKHGTCKELSPTEYKCECEYEYTGKFCRVPKCISRQECGVCTRSWSLKRCENNGKCLELVKGDTIIYNCTYSKDFTGGECKIAVNKHNPCRTGDCRNGATCVHFEGDQQRSYCKCRDGFSGEFCQYQSSCEACRRNHKICESHAHGCKCAGKNCLLNCVETQSCGVCRNYEGCKHGGTCVEIYNTKNDTDGFAMQSAVRFCKCLEGYSNTFCEFKEPSNSNNGGNNYNTHNYPYPYIERFVTSWKNFTITDAIIIFVLVVFIAVVVFMKVKRHRARRPKKGGQGVHGKRNYAMS